MKKLLVVIFVISALISIRAECGSKISPSSAVCWVDSYGILALGTLGPLGTSGVILREGFSATSRTLLTKGIRYRGGLLSLKGSLQWGRYEVLNTSLWQEVAKRYPVRALRTMVERGNAGRVDGKVIHLHHHLRRGEGPLVMLTSDIHQWADDELHPKGSRSSVNRPIFRGERKSLWKRLACEELNRRGLRC